MTIEIVGGGVTPGDEASICAQLRAVGSALTPDYDPSTQVLMDSWNYQNLLGDRNFAVWQQVENDMNNMITSTTNVSKYKYASVFVLVIDIHFDDLYSGYNSQTVHVNKVSKSVVTMLGCRTTG